ncbi:hypothetical protein [Nocardia macrotermitis]|uniref:Uncharacterized protein n=1 Tax=Nocardia macrotermitis TaxID=2585198 RepID=A0A7K0D4Z4_9NOCA|nr:hypothetical protein [Nocardia macrotermitis]MQY20800.1 hypothetical protein [Nocardia macrotermitis]
MDSDDHTEIYEVALPVRIRPDFEPSAVTEFHEDGFVMELTTTLPDVCSEHGLPAIGKCVKDIRFRRTEGGWAQRTAITLLGDVSRMLGRWAVSLGMGWSSWTTHRDPDGVLEGVWPFCTHCVRVARMYRWLAHAVIIAGVAVFLTGCVLGLMEIRSVPLAAVTFFSIVCGPYLAALAYIRSGTLVRIQPITDATTVTLDAAPAFVAAYEHGTAAGNLG